MDNPSCPKNIFNSWPPERWAHPNSLGILCSGYKAKKDMGKKISKLPPKHTKIEILSKGSSEPRCSSWTSSPGTRCAGREPQQLEEHLEPFPGTKACGKGQAVERRGWKWGRLQLPVLLQRVPPGFLSLLKEHESVFSSATQRGILSSTPNPCATPLPMLILI